MGGSHKLMNRQTCSLAEKFTHANTHAHTHTYPSPSKHSRQVILSPQREHSHWWRGADLKIIQSWEYQSCSTVPSTGQDAKIADMAE